MLAFLAGGATDRKLRLFAVANCRRIRLLLRDQRARDALEIAERFADGLVGDEERSEARRAAQQAAQGRGVTDRPTAPKWERRAAAAVYYAAARVAREAAFTAPSLAVEAIIWQAGGHTKCDPEAIKRSEQPSQASLLRDLFGNPFRATVADPACLTWHDATVPMIAHAIYHAGDFGRLPVLADALEDAGCDDADIFNHCRSDRSHVRGCWVVDLLTGRG
jgi:hypothetical protein